MLHPDQIKAGKIVAKTIAYGIDLCLSKKMPAEEIDLLIEKFIIREGGEPALKGYRPPFSNLAWNHSLCLSTGKEVAHGIPAEKTVGPNDLIKIDLVVKVGEWYADAARTFSGNNKYKSLVEDGWLIFENATRSVQPNAPIRNFSLALALLTDHYNYHIPRAFCGHGIGKLIHDEPHIFNNPSDFTTDCFIPQKTYAVEPIITKNKCIISLSRNGWTYLTDCLSVHNENTYWVEATGVRNITNVEDYI